MNPKAKQKLVNQIVDIISHAKAPSIADETSRRARIFGSGEIYFSLLDEAADQYDWVVKNLFEESSWSSKFSENYIDEYLLQLLADAVKSVREGNIEQIASYVAECVDRLVENFENYSLEQTVYIPLAGIILNIEELNIGKITLITMTDERFRELLERMRSELDQYSISQEEKDRAFQTRVNELYPRIGGKVCAEFHTIAEPNRAVEQAVEACRPALDLLRYSMHMIHRSAAESYRMAVGFPDDVFRVDRYTVVIETVSVRFTASSQLRGPLAPFIIDNDTKDRMEKIGTFKVGRVMVKQNTTKFEKALLRGIRSFGKSYTHTEAEDRFLSLIACLENFIRTDREERIAKAVAEGTALVLGTNPNERIAFRDTIKDSYDTRSAIVHGRKVDVLAADLNRLRDIVGGFVSRMIQWVDRFNDQEALVVWIDEQKFGDRAGQQDLIHS